MPAETQLEAVVADRLFALFVHLMQTARSDQLGLVAELDLTHSQCKMLGLLGQDADVELSLKELAGGIGISLPAASRGIENLLQRGYVERREDAEDRRMKRVRITGAGLEIGQAMYGAKYDAIREFAASLSASEAERLRRALEPIVARPEIQACRPKDPVV
ncbi:MAG: transcriptional regulator, MarR family [Solirubrobacterales bacterium]|jgi:DNA-binding MarR family transcriptional regulator|nr:transcriptional regulator, MarR family [Solirubrobacterales bacterium]